MNNNTNKKEMEKGKVEAEKEKGDMEATVRQLSQQLHNLESLVMPAVMGDLADLKKRVSGIEMRQQEGDGDGVKREIGEQGNAARDSGENTGERVEGDGAGENTGGIETTLEEETKEEIKITLEEVAERVKERKASQASRDARYPLQSFLEDAAEVDPVFVGPVVRSMIDVMGRERGMLEAGRWALMVQKGVGDRILGRVAKMNPNNRNTVRMKGGVPLSLWKFECEEAFKGASLMPMDLGELDTEALQIVFGPYQVGPQVADGVRACEEMWRCVKDACRDPVDSSRWVYLMKGKLAAVEQLTSGDQRHISAKDRAKVGQEVLALAAGMIHAILTEGGEWGNGGAGLTGERGREIVTLLGLGCFLTGMCNKLSVIDVVLTTCYCRGPGERGAHQGHCGMVWDRAHSGCRARPDVHGEQEDLVGRGGLYHVVAGG